MSYLTSLLISLTLTGLFCAVANLLLPRHLSGLGRLMKVLCATVFLLILVSPLFSLLTDGKAALDALAEEFSPQIQTTAPRDDGAERAVVAASSDALCETVRASLVKALQREDFSIETAYVPRAEGINPVCVLIYYSDESFDSSRAAQWVEAKFGLEARTVLREGAA